MKLTWFMSAGMSAALLGAGLLIDNGAMLFASGILTGMCWLSFNRTF